MKLEREKGKKTMKKKRAKETDGQIMVNLHPYAELEKRPFGFQH